MAELPEIEARLTAVEARLDVVAADAAATRHLAAARDRDLADFGVKVDANRAVISALGEQTAARFDRLEERFDGLEGQMHAGFTQMRAGFDQVAGGFEHIGGLLDELVRREPPTG
ncbi:MAG TPA: hypothetical protein VHU88_09170 [Sporichthyaceae bacterium]|jgi:hypothetical protein|nr:hypothetical protein [Sporichthyaceae bacterium]